MSDDIFTRCFRPPEVLLKSGIYGTASDMWALGMSLLNMASGYFVTGNDDHDYLVEIFGLLGKPRKRDVPSYAHVYNPTHYAQRTEHRLVRHLGELENQPLAVDFLMKLLALEPTYRITATAALRHPFISDQGMPPPKWLRIRQGLEWSCHSHDLSHHGTLLVEVNLLPVVRMKMLTMRALHLSLELFFAVPGHIVSRATLAACILLANTLTDFDVMSPGEAARSVGCDPELVIPAACSVLEHTHCHIARATLADILGWELTHPVKDVAGFMLLDLLTRPIFLATKGLLRGIAAQNALVRVAQYVAAPGVFMLKPERDTEFVCTILPLLTPTTPRFTILRQWITGAQQPLFQRQPDVTFGNFGMSAAFGSAPAPAPSSTSSSTASSISSSPVMGCVIE